VQPHPIGLQGGPSTYVYVTNNSLGLIDPLRLNGQMSRHKGRQANRGTGGRVGIVGCPFNCASYIEGVDSAKSSFSLSFGGAILVSHFLKIKLRQKEHRKSIRVTRTESIPRARFQEAQRHRLVVLVQFLAGRLILMVVFVSVWDLR
jgi:uncharacterized protein RhaS with RHS repeats